MTASHGRNHVAITRIDDHDGQAPTATTTPQTVTTKHIETVVWDRLRKIDAIFDPVCGASR